MSSPEQASSAPVVVDLASLSTNLPPAPRPEVWRDSIVSTLKTLLQEDVYAVTIEGKEGIGKSTVLSQFVRSTAKSAISVFVSAANRLSYDPDIVRSDLSMQVYWVLTGDILDRSKYDPGLLKTYYVDLQRQAKQRKTLIYFVIDGIEELGETERFAFIQQISDILPFGMTQFRFLLSGDENLYSNVIGQKLAVKSYPVTEFGVEDTRALFSSYDLSIEMANELRGICRGMPSRLTGVLRAMDKGLKIDEFIRDAPSKWPEFFEIDWKQVEPSDEELKRVLALLVFDRKPHTIADVAAILDIPTQDVQARLAKINFVSVDPTVGDIRFANDGLRKYIAEQLRDRRPHIYKRLIKRLLSTPTSSESSLELTEYLEEASHFQDLLDFLTPEHILRILEHSQTLSRVDETVKRGFRSAKKLGRDPDILRFGLQKAIVAEFAAANIWASEVGALAALHRDTEALALANNAILREDRLQMLTALAHGIWTRGDPVAAELLDQIRLLIDNLDFWSLGRRARSIASNLVCVSPDLATTVLKKAKWGGDDNELDRTFADLTIKAIRDLKDERRRAETLDSLSRSRQDQKARGLLEGVRVLSGRLSPNDVCRRCDEIQQTDAKLLVLRHWSALNADVPESDLVALHALKVALATTSSRIDASFVADLSRTLYGCPNIQRKKELIFALDGVRATAQRLGPSVDYVRLQSSIACAEVEFDASAAKARLLETQDYITQIGDLPSRGEAYACLLGTVKCLPVQIEPAGTLIKKYETELDMVVLTLVESTADHELALGSIIAALAPGDIDRALDYAQTLNTEARRDAVLLDIVRALLQLPADQIAVSQLQRILDRIAGFEPKDEAQSIILERFAEEPDLRAGQLNSLIPIVSQLGSMCDSVLCCRALVGALTILDRSKSEETGLLEDHLWTTLHNRWSDIDTGWVRIDTGFGIAKDMASFDVDRANDILTQTEALKSDWRIAARRPALAYMACIRLVIRALCGLLPRHLETDADIQMVAALIEILPGYGDRAVLWADFCLRASLADRLDLTQRLVNNYLEPSFTKIPSGDIAYRRQILIQIAPALYKSQPAACLEHLRGVDVDTRDVALWNIIRFLLSNRAPDDSGDTSSPANTKTTYETLLTVASLAEHLETDWVIYVTTKEVAELLEAPVNKFSISKPQREDLAHRFERLADARLPMARHICHDGYRIVTLAEAARMRQAKPSEWKQIIADARTLENVSDRVYVLENVALALPKGMSSDREKIIDDARQLIPSIPWQFDQIERCVGLAEDVHGIDTNLCRELIQQAATVIPKSSVDIREQRRRLVDIAYKVDETLAQQLIDAFDDDEAKRLAQTQLHFLELRKEIAESAADHANPKALKQIRSTEVARLGWSLVRALGAGRVQHYHPNEIREYLEMAAEEPLNRAYSVLAWYVENAVVRYSRTDQAGTFLRPILSACNVGAQLAGQIAGKALIRLRALKHQSTTLSEGRSLLITPGSRSDAQRILAIWFENNLTENIKIHDPYFSPEDIEWLQLIRTVKPNCSICVLTSRRHQPTLGPGEDLEDLYAQAWRRKFDQSPPRAEIAVIGGEKTKDSPIHDRWLVSGGSGIRFGTSFNSLGITKDSEISEMSPQDVEQKSLELDQYLNREKVEHNGEKLRLTRFWLD